MANRQRLWVWDMRPTRHHNAITTNHRMDRNLLDSNTGSIKSLVDLNISSHTAPPGVPSRKVHGCRTYVKAAYANCSTSSTSCCATENMPPLSHLIAASFLNLVSKFLSCCDLCFINACQSSLVLLGQVLCTALQSKVAEASASFPHVNFWGMGGKKLFLICIKCSLEWQVFTVQMIIQETSFIPKLNSQGTCRYRSKLCK